MSEPPSTVAILDFGGQYTHLIAKEVRARGLFSRILAPERFQPRDHPEVVGAILSGSPGSAADPRRVSLAFDPLRAPFPVLGLCFGHQLLAALAGGRVSTAEHGEYGLATLRVRGGRLFRDLPPRQPVWMSHRDCVVSLPEAYRITASTESHEIAAFEDPEQRLFGLQFHPEVAHTEHGGAILEHFLSTCTAERTWRPGRFADLVVRRIRQEAGEDRLFLLVSGGVDSLVALTVCVRAVGADRVHGLHVDTGLMRLEESDAILQALREEGFENLRCVRAGDRFFSALAGVADPEEKRAIIGRLFVEEVERELARSGCDLGQGWKLVQGTIYPDRIESGGRSGAARIKTHHNRVEEIRRLVREGRVIEPLGELYKHEVRQLGAELRLPERLLKRHPFPGPGLGVRILASDTDRPLFDLTDAQERAEAIAAGHGFGVRVLPVRSVGVQGDQRTWRHPAVLWGDLDWERLERCARDLVNRLASINRVVYAPAGLPPDLEPARVFVSRVQADRLRRVDHRAMTRTAGLAGIWQMPVVALPLFHRESGQAFVLRPVCSRDAMTATFYRMAPDRLRSLVRELCTLEGVAAVFYDVTSKPPATIEWE